MQVYCTDLNFPRSCVPIRSLTVGDWFELDGRANLVVEIYLSYIEVVTFAPTFVRTVYFRDPHRDTQVNPISIEQIDVRFIRKPQ